jgi:hypothetical protein
VLLLYVQGGLGISPVSTTRSYGPAGNKAWIIAKQEVGRFTSSMDESRRYRRRPYRLDRRLNEPRP